MHDIDNSYSSDDLDDDMDYSNLDQVPKPKYLSLRKRTCLITFNPNWDCSFHDYNSLRKKFGSLSVERQIY